MRLLVLSLFVGVVLAVPQGYNYRLHLGSDESENFTYEQLQLLQQFASQQEQSTAQHQTITITAPTAPAFSQNVAQAHDNGGSSTQQTQQLVGYAEQQQPQQLHSAQQVAVSQSALPTQQTQELSLALQQQTLPFEQPQYQLQPAQQLIPQPQLQHQLHPQPQPQPQPQSAPQPQSQIQFQFTPQPQPQLQPKTESVSQQQQLVQPSSAALPQPVVQAEHDQPKSASVNADAPTQYNKQYYFLSAPQEPFELPHDFQNSLNKIRKNLRVIFIKAPEQNGIQKAALQLAKDMQNSQTAIYVLTKQHTGADLAEKLQQLRATSPQKPEVVFVKYRTPEEAKHAQHTIQSQYEALNGPNHFNYEGAVPTHNFIGSLAAIEPRQGTTVKSATTKAPTASSLDYLPPAE